jgi:membrane protein implicated in regulation of membrane protease activity
LNLLPWEYFWIGFNKINFPDLFDPVWIGSGILLIVLVVLYVLRTRALHRHRLYLDMWEWIFWSGLITYFLLIVGSIFQFDFAVILVLLFSGLFVMAWARFRRFPPLFEAYEHQLARQRYLARARSSRPEATIRQKSVRRRGKKR